MLVAGPWVQRERSLGLDRMRLVAQARWCTCPVWWIFKRYSLPHSLAVDLRLDRSGPFPVLLPSGVQIPQKDEMGTVERSH